MVSPERILQWPVLKLKLRCCEMASCDTHVSSQSPRITTRILTSPPSASASIRLRGCQHDMNPLGAAICPRRCPRSPTGTGGLRRAGVMPPVCFIFMREQDANWRGGSSLPAYTSWSTGGKAEEAQRYAQAPSPSTTVDFSGRTSREVPPSPSIVAKGRPFA